MQTENSKPVSEKPYTVTPGNLKRGVFKVCELGNHEKCPATITHRHADPQNNIWNFQCTCECHGSAFGDLSDEDRCLQWAVDRIVQNPDISETFRRGVLVASRRRADG